MTASQPPEPPHGGPPPGPAQPPWGQPAWGQQPPPPGYGPPPGQQPPPPGQQGYGQPPPWSAPPPGYGQQPGHRPPAGSGTTVDRTKLRMAEYVIAGGTLLFFVLAFLPWRDYGDFLFSTASGWETGQVSVAFVLFLLATAWALLPAFADVQVGFPRAWITVGLAALGFLLTLLSWIASFDAGFSLWALLGLLTAAAILAFAVLSLLPELRNRPALPGALAGAAQWANQPGPDASARPAAPAPWSAPAPPPPPPGPASPPPPPSTGSTAAGSPPPPPPDAGSPDRPPSP